MYSKSVLKRIKVQGEEVAHLHFTAAAVQDIVKEHGAGYLLKNLDDETTFALWKELTTLNFYGS